MKSLSPSYPRVQTQQQQTRNGENYEGNEEENKPKRNQSRSIEVADRFREFIGYGRRNGRTGSQQGTRNSMRVADHEGDRHRLTECAAEAEHDAADHTNAGVREDDVAHDFPGGATESVGRLFQHGWHGLEHVAR